MVLYDRVKYDIFILFYGGKKYDILMLNKKVKVNKRLIQMKYINDYK